MVIDKQLYFMTKLATNLNALPYTELREALKQYPKQVADLVSKARLTMQVGVKING